MLCFEFMKKTQLAMIATIFRILIVPLIIAIMILQPQLWNWYSAGLFVIASITDWLDGYWARKYDSVSILGQFLDPVADKVLVSSILILLIPMGRIEALAVIILINRDVFISGLRSIAASQGLVISAGPMGKWKTALQMVAIPLILIGEKSLGFHLETLGYWGIWGSVILSVISGFQYVMAFFAHKKIKI